MGTLTVVVSGIGGTSACRASINYAEEKEKQREIEKAIADWCLEHIGQALPVTCIKDFEMIELWDDRAVAVETNTGKVLGGGRLKDAP